MRLLSSQLKAWGLILVCGGAFALAAGCGSDDGKKKLANEAEAGAAGANEGGHPSSGGSQSTPGGVAGDAGAGQVPVEAGAGAGGVPVSGEGGASGDSGAGGAPVIADCGVDGSVTGLSLLTEPTYQGCRGSVVRVPFDADDSSDEFFCCGVSTSKPAFGAQVVGESNQDGGGELLMQVPADAPFGSYAVSLTCATQGDYSFGLEVNDVAAPIVTSAPAFTAVGETFTVTGENLADIISIRAFRPRDATIAFCNIDQATQTATSVSCSFNAIPQSADNDDYYLLDVASNDCGSAANRPKFIVNLNTR